MASSGISPEDCEEISAPIALRVAILPRSLPSRWSRASQAVEELPNPSLWRILYRPLVKSVADRYWMISARLVVFDVLDIIKPRKECNEGPPLTQHSRNEWALDKRRSDSAHAGCSTCYEILVL